MFLGKVIGNLQATTLCRGCEGLAGIKFLWVQPQLGSGEASGAPIVACDATFQAGIGDVVYMVDGREATMALPDDFVPVDISIVGIVDEVAGQ